MLIYGILLAAAAAAGALYGLCAWSVWQALLAFLGISLGLLLAAFGFLCLICALVDTNKPQTKDSPFYRRVMYLYIEALIMLLGVRIHPQGLEKTPKEGRFLLVCNHLELPDPGVLLYCFRKSQLAFVSKRENMSMFLIGKFMHKTMCQMINRDNDREALRTILRCVQLLKEDQVSVAIFPEGYCSVDGRVRHFRPGAFKIAQKAKVPIVVCTIRNTQNLLKNVMHLKPTHIPLHLVDVIPAQELAGKTSVEISDRVYEMMIGDLGEEYRALETREE